MVKDWAFMSAFDKNDIKFLYEFARRVRASVDYSFKHNIRHNPVLTNEYFAACEKKHNDHNGVFQVGNRQVEIQQTAKADDLAVNDGLDQCIRLIQNTSTAVFRYGELGSTGSTPQTSNTFLVTPYSGRTDMASFGSREPVGMTIRFLAIFGEFHPASVIRECAVLNQAAGGIMLNRNTFSENPLNRQVGVQPAIMSSIVEFCPKA